MQEDDGKGTIYPEILYDRLIHRLKFEKKNYRNLLSSNQNILNNYFLAFSRLTDSYMNGGNTDKALLVMDYFRKTFPSNDVKYNYYIYPFISNYFKAGKNDEAIKMLKTCINCCKSELESLINVKNKVSNDEKLTLEVFSLRELQNISSIYIPNHALINEINELVKKYDANQTD